MHKTAVKRNQLPLNPHKGTAEKYNTKKTQTILFDSFSCYFLEI